MKKLIKLTQFSSGGLKPFSSGGLKPVLIGIENIIKVEECEISGDSDYAKVTKIKSRGAMIETTYVVESLEEIYNLINNQNN